MKTFPCAKINLGLYVVERRPDGYHNLETVFYPIPLCDELEIVPAAEDQLAIEGFPVDGQWRDNLVWRVVKQLRDGGLPIPPIVIRLRKTIPMGAGLGGGSSDAAHTMLMLNEMFHLGLSDDDMEQRLSRLGADCPFFVRRQPVFATGIGDQFTPVALSLTGQHLLLVKPSDHVSTREAYSAVRPRHPQHPLLQSIQRPISEWQQLVGNDFEQSVFPQHPTIADIKQQLINNGALYAAMSGSGSAVFGIFAQAPSPQLIASFSSHFTFTAPL
ncbi:MAG: 4-(cytidine 5'-diphospho)-2-C-methyl-D-erythritol kinase [Bacteroidaceae bacterium]|nr:4-(cytidine 5'-diphospho)-2-C-methyl-D-erythritol kinase [Bacteroidaceae bacterium]